MMDEHVPSGAEMSYLGRLKRSYASLAAWMAGETRISEPGRQPCVPRIESAARTTTPSRIFVPSRPTKDFTEPT